MRRALAGVGTLLLIPATEGKGRTGDHRTTVEAAVAAGVRHIVYLSFIGASPDCTFTLARDHWATEQDIRRIAPAYTLLRMNMYLDFVPQLAGPDGMISGPAGDGRVSAVLRDDLADVAVAVLAKPHGHIGQTYDGTGGESFTLAEVAARAGISRITLYRRADLHVVVDEHRGRGRDATTLSGLVVQIDQLRRSLEAVAAKVRRHEETIRRLERARREPRQ